jgi:hypothetical protein
MLPLCTNFFIGFCNCSEFDYERRVILCVSFYYIPTSNYVVYNVNWCPECDEGLCAACENHHKISRGTRYHGIISIENYKKLPSCISEISHHCKDPKNNLNINIYYCQRRFLNVSCIEFASLYEFFYWILQLFRV